MVKLYYSLLWDHSRDDYDVMGTVGDPSYAGGSTGKLGIAFDAVYVGESTYMDIHSPDDDIIFLLRNTCIEYL